MVNFSRRRPARHATLAAHLFCLVFWACPVPVEGHSPRWASRRMACNGNLKQIALALHNYHDVYKSFPPAYVPDKDGQPMHSWRVLILPFLDQKSLYEEYDFNEPWNGPHNSTLAARMPSCYYCVLRGREAIDKGYTSYFVPVGSDLAFQGATARTLRDFPQGTSSTILVISHHSKQTNWLEPADIPLEEAIRHLASQEQDYESEHWAESFFSRSLIGFDVAIADGSLTSIPHGCDREAVAKMLSVSDESPLPDLNGIAGTPLRIHKYRNWLFVPLLVAPHCWLLWCYFRTRSIWIALLLLIVFVYSLMLIPGVVVFYY